MTAIWQAAGLAFTRLAVTPAGPLLKQLLKHFGNCERQAVLSIISNMLYELSDSMTIIPKNNTQKM